MGIRKLVATTVAAMLAMGIGVTSAEAAVWRTMELRSFSECKNTGEAMIRNNKALKYECIGAAGKTLRYLDPGSGRGPLPS